jgi:hypothetical protein
MSNYEDYPIQSEFRAEFLADLEELALKGGKTAMDGVEIEVELINEGENGE